MPGRTPYNEWNMQNNQEGSIVISEEDAQSYENGFISYLMEYIKKDDVLQNFYWRLVYECEVSQRVIDQASDVDIQVLEDSVNQLVNSCDLQECAIYDSAFHKQLFAIINEGHFFEWWRLQTYTLKGYLVHFWRAIGFETPAYRELMEIHKQIVAAIKERDKEKVIAYMERHFSILLFQLLGTLYTENKDPH